LPALKDQLSCVKIKSPIEQHMLGRGGLFRQENIEKRRILSVREWAELCSKDDFKAPGVEDVGLHARSAAAILKPPNGRKRVATRKSEIAELDDIKQESVDENLHAETPTQHHLSNAPLASPPDTITAPATPFDAVDGDRPADTPAAIPECADSDMGSLRSGSVENDEKPSKAKAKRPSQTREAREASLAERAARDVAFLETFDPHSHWLPPNTKPSDYTMEFCQKLERQYWRNCGLGKPAWYGADTQGVSSGLSANSPTLTHL
jgi:hypothetical protein